MVMLGLSCRCVSDRLLRRVRRNGVMSAKPYVVRVWALAANE